MQLVKGFGLVVLAVVAIAVGYSILFICEALEGKTEVVSGEIEPVTAAKIELEVKPDYSIFTIRELKAMARGTGIKSWEKLRKAELVSALACL